MILDRLSSSNAMMAVAQLRVLGGAMSRVPVDATAFAHRKSRIMVNLAALYENPADKPTHEAWVADFAAALQQADHGAYVNFLGEDGEDRIHAAYPAPTWERLRKIKTRYDPTNLFRLNQNIPPVSGDLKE
jgi:FAD/FMN-containing dehydrogenase